LLTSRKLQLQQDAKWRDCIIPYVLLDKIIELATNTDKPLSVLLRQCVVLGHELKNDSIKNWANQELSGYTDPTKVPQYRIVNAGAKGTFRAGYAFPSIIRPIPTGSMEENHRWAADTVYLVEPVSSYESNLKAAKGHSLHYQWTADMVVYYQDRFMPGHALTMAWQEVPWGAIAGLLDTLRTRVLNVALDIKAEIGESDADLKTVATSSEKAEKINHIVINHIYGGTVYIADQQIINTQNIAVGNWQDLRNALLVAGIQERDIGELSQAIEQDNKTFGTRVKSWIATNATKVLDKGLQVGASVGTTVLTEYMKRHFGL
jgi:hypothetical protein